MASDKLPPGWRRVRAGLYQHNDPFALVHQDNLGRWKVSINLRAPDGSLRSWHSHGYAAARDAMAAGHGLLAATPLGLADRAGGGTEWLTTARATHSDSAGSRSGSQRNAAACPTTPPAQEALCDPPVRTCPKCGAKAAAFICAERGCPVNGGAAHD